MPCDVHVGFQAASLPPSVRQGAAGTDMQGKSVEEPRKKTMTIELAVIGGTLGVILGGAVLSIPGLMQKGLDADYKNNLY